MTSVSREPVVLKFGEDELKVRPLTLSQVEAIYNILGDDGAALAKSPVPVGIEIVAIALTRDHPEKKAGDLEGTAQDIASAVGKILGLAFEQKVGETSAAAKTA